MAKSRYHDYVYPRFLSVKDPSPTFKAMIDVADAWRDQFDSLAVLVPDNEAMQSADLAADATNHKDLQ